MSYRNGDDRNSARNRLYRNTEEGMILGVCAGIADYFGFDLTATRVVTVIAALIFPPTILISYFLFGFLLKKAPSSRAYSTPERELRRKHVRAEPHATLDSIRHRFRELDRRMQRLERIVTSKRFHLQREFDGLKD